MAADDAVVEQRELGLVGRDGRVGSGEIDREDVAAERHACRKLDQAERLRLMARAAEEQRWPTRGERVEEWPQLRHRLRVLLLCPPARAR